jgi:hypothetical protein
MPPWDRDAVLLLGQRLESDIVELARVADEAEPLLL